MSRRGFVWGVLFGVFCAAALGGTNLRQYTVQEALNKLIGARPHEYTTQEALNVILTKPTVNDTLVAHFSMIWDDGIYDVFDSIAVFDQYGWDCAVSVIGDKSLSSDTSSGSSPTRYMGREPLRRLLVRGWEFGSHSYTGALAIYSGGQGSDATGLIGAGNFSSLDTFLTFITQNQEVITDTLGLPAPRYYSCPNTSTTWWQKPTLSRLFDYAVNTSQTALAHSGNQKRPNTDYIVQTYRAGSGLDVAVSALPGRVPDNLEIRQTLAESNNRTAAENAIKRAVQTKGWVVFIGHSPAIWTSSGLTSGGGMSGFFSWVNENYVQTGLLRVTTPGVAFDYYFRRPIGSGANFIFPNFDDIDGDGTPDGWFNTAGVTFSPDSTGYGPWGYATLAWDNLGDSATNPETFHNITSPWHVDDATIEVYPPLGGGKQIQVEFFAIIDPDIMRTAEGAGFSVEGDSVGVVFYAGWDEQQYRWGSSPDEVMAPDAANEHALITSYMSNIDFNTNVEPGGVLMFAQRDTLGNKWTHYVGGWSVPERAEWVRIAIWKGGNLPADAVRISGLSVTFSERNGTDRW